MCQLLGVRCLSLVTITDALLYLGGRSSLVIQMAKKQIAMQDFIYIYIYMFFLDLKLRCCRKFLKI